MSKGVKTETATDMYNEQTKLEWDTKAYMYGKVVNKHARHNLCYGNISKNQIMQIKKVELLVGIMYH